MKKFGKKLFAILTLIVGVGHGQLAGNLQNSPFQDKDSVFSFEEGMRSNFSNNIDQRKWEAMIHRSPVFVTNNCTPIAVPSSYATSIKSEGDCRPTFICPKVFEAKGRNGIIIDRPGHYVLAGNVRFNPTQPNVQAITITASNVTLDLDSHVLAQVNTQPGVYGIAIARDVNNVRITGSESVAEILDFTLAGIRVLGRTDQILLENVTVTQTNPVYFTDAILPEDCTELGCAPINGGIYVGEGELSGYAFYGTDKNNLVRNLKIDDVTVKNCIIGSQIVETYGVQVDNSSFVENTFVGLLLGSFLPIPADEPNTIETIVAGDVTIRNSHFNDNVNNDVFSLTKSSAALYTIVAGLFIQDTKNVIVEASTFNNNSCDASSCGLIGGGVNSLVIRDSVFNGNLNPGGSNAIGCCVIYTVGVSFAPCIGIEDFLPQHLSRDLIIENSSASGNKRTGFHLFGVDGSCISDCVAENNFQDLFGLPGSVSGFVLQSAFPSIQSRGNTFLRCTSSNNGNIGPFNQATGFVVRSDSRKVVFKDCIASNNGQSNDNLAGTTAGFYFFTEAYSTDFDFRSQDIILDNCIAIGNGTPEQTGVNSAGIAFRTPTNRAPLLDVLIQGCTLAYNVRGVFFTDDIPGLVIKRCEADQNFISGFDLTNITSPALVTQNIAYANGPAGLVNYLGVPAANVVTFASSALPDGTVVGFKNISITP